MVCSTIGEVRNGSGDPRGGPGLVMGLTGRSGTCWGLSMRFGTGRGALGEVRDGSEDPRGGLGRVGGPSRISGTSQGNHQGCLGRFVALSGIAETVWRTLGEVRDYSLDPLGGLGWVGDSQTGSLKLSRTTPRVPRPVPDLSEGPPTRLEPSRGFPESFRPPQGSPDPSRTAPWVQ